MCDDKIIIPTYMPAPHNLKSIINLKIKVVKDLRKVA